MLHKTHITTHQSMPPSHLWFLPICLLSKQINRWCSLHTALCHLEHPSTQVRMLFLDYSSGFNNIIPDILVDKLIALDFPSVTCDWMKDFFFFFLQTAQRLLRSTPIACQPSHSAQALHRAVCWALSCMQVTPMIALPPTPPTIIVCWGYHMRCSGWQSGVWRITWCLNTKKSKEVIIDLRRHKAALTHFLVNGDCVERLPTFKLLGTYILWERLSSVYTSWGSSRGTGCCSTIESVLAYFITMWYAGYTAWDRKRLQRVIKSSQKNNWLSNALPG